MRVTREMVLAQLASGEWQSAREIADAIDPPRQRSYFAELWHAFRHPLHDIWVRLYGLEAAGRVECRWRTLTPAQLAANHGHRLPEYRLKPDVAEAV